MGDNSRAAVTAALFVVQLAATALNQLTGAPGIGAAFAVTLLQPPGAFFGLIWATLYSWLLAFVVWQWLARASPVARRMAWFPSIAFATLAVWGAVASGVHDTSRLVVELPLLLLLFVAAWALRSAGVAACGSAHELLSPRELLLGAAPLSALCGWLTVAAALLLADIALLLGASWLAATSPSVAGAACVLLLLGCALASLQAGPFQASPWSAAPFLWGLFGAGVAAGGRAGGGHALLEAAAALACAAVVGATVACTTAPPRWGWPSRWALALRAACVPAGRGDEAAPLLGV